MVSYIWKSPKREVSESEAENYILAEKWHSYSGYVNYDSVKHSILSTKLYYETQKNLSYYCSEDTINSFLEKNKVDKNTLRKIIRYGVPMKFTKDVILKLCKVDKSSINESFNKRFFSIFKNFDPKYIGNHVPYLTFKETLEENLPEFFLNDQGLNQVKELLWLTYTLIPSIEYCPLLIKLMSLLLVFMNKAEVYTVCKNIMIEDFNEKELFKLRFKLRFTVEDNKKIVHSFLDCLTILTKNMGKNLSNKLNQLGLKFDKLIEDLFFNFFLGYFNFHVLQRILLLYINEGIKTFYRVAYALLKLCQREIMECSSPDDVYKLLKQKGQSLRDFDQFFKTAFSFKLTRNNNRYNEVKILDQERKRQSFIHSSFYIPSLSGSSKIIPEQDILALWKIFPENLKMKDAKIVYSTWGNRCELNKMYEICREPENSVFYCMLLIQTKTDEVFGSILSAPFDISINTHYRPSFLSLITFKPIMKRYDEVKVSDKVIYNSTEKLIIGDGSFGPAIQLDKEIMIGYNFPCDLFNSECFLKGKNTFEVENVELFILY